MSFEPGTRLGAYEVTALIGSGGMGVVYRARDTRLGRDVAIKVLPDALGADLERVARFEREAHALAVLNHPHIATIHGVEEVPATRPGQTPVRALVLELVEGPTLAECIESSSLDPGSREGVRARRRGLPLADALRTARQIADAIEAAHEKGIIHRDLKPANVKLTPEGSVKVLDFGLAKLAAEGRDPELTQLPTVTAGGTREGVILGTARYMSPEQARGQRLDKRTDIWSFGCVLYELLAGRAAFPGPTQSDTIAAILGGGPDWSLLPENTPAAVCTLLRRCLEKDPRQRLRDIGDARIELDTAIVPGTHPPLVTARTSADPSVGRRSWLRRLAPVGVIGAVVALTLAWSTGLRPGADLPVESVHLTVLLPPGVTVARGPGMPLSLALSPDGGTLVVAGSNASGVRLYQRRLDRLEATPLAGTEGGLSPFFSPDGAWLGFFANRRLKRVPARGGAAVDIADAPAFPAGASWGPDDRIVFASGARSPLRIVPASGGTAAPLTEPDAGQGHVYPQFLPDGHTVLFNQGARMYALDLASVRRGMLGEGVIRGYAPSGHLIFCRGTALLAASFDPTRFELAGPAVPLIEGVALDSATGDGLSHVAVSPNGTLAYLPAARGYELVLVGANGTQRLLEQAALFENPRFSPDGRRLVVATRRRGEDALDLWIHDLEGGTPPSRLTFDGGRAPVWTPDGRAVTYSHPVAGERWGIYTRFADGRGEARRDIRLSEFHWLVGWTPDRRTLGYGTMEPVAADGVSRSSIVAFRDGASRKVVGPGDTWGGRLAPDGRWLAYYVRDAGYFEVYVSPFPDADTRYLIAEGTDPAWSPDGTEVYYRSGSRLMAARLDTATGVRVLSQRVVIEPFSPPAYDDYDIHPDGRMMALVRPAGGAQGREITLVLNWFAELQRLTSE